MNNYNNYWKLDLNEIPTRGILYPEHTEIMCRPLNVQEVKYLSTFCEQNATMLLNSIIEKCVELKGIDFPDLYLADREYIIFWLRVNSFSRNNGYDLTIPKCEGCGQEFSQQIALTDFDTAFYYKEAPKIYLPDSNMIIQLKYPKWYDLSIKSEDENLTNIIRMIDCENSSEERESFVKNLSALDYSVLTNNIDDMFIGFKRDVTITCPTCMHPHIYKMVINDCSLFSPINLFEILEVILRISKYTKFQITDEMPWMEIEVMQEVVNKMAEEEKQENEKAKGNFTMNKPNIDGLKSKLPKI